MKKITVQLAIDGPITEMDECELVQRIELIDNDVERTTVTEYRLASDPNGRAVHRSVDMVLKKAAVFATGEAGSFL